MVNCPANQRCGTCCTKPDGGIRYLACGSAPYNKRTGFSAKSCEAAKANYLAKKCAGLTGSLLTGCLTGGIKPSTTSPKLPPSPRGLNIKGSGKIGTGPSGSVKGSTAKKRLGIKGSGSSNQGVTGGGTIDTGQLEAPAGQQSTGTPTGAPSSETTDFFANNGIFIIAGLALVVLMLVL